MAKWKTENWECVGCKYGPAKVKTSYGWLYWVLGAAVIFFLMACCYYTYTRYYKQEEEEFEEEE